MLRKSHGIIHSGRWLIDNLMTQCPALVYENTEVVIVQTDAKTFADMFPYPICNLCAVSLLYFTICQRLTKFMTSTSLSAKTWESGSRPRNSEGVLLSGGHRWELALIRWPPLNKTRLPLGKPNSLMARPMQGPRRGAREPRPQGANPAISTRS